MSDIRRKAREMGVKAVGKKPDLIRGIQKAEGNDPCYGTRRVCGQMDCCWRDDCLSGPLGR